ncbi:MAG: 30S ribosomal protein S3 [Candidatus Spechtbacterales bacterium]
MTHKVHPLGYRLGVTKDWKSRWLDLKHYSLNVKQDYAIRNFVKTKFKNAGVQGVEIERFAQQVSVIIYTSRPGILIGRGGSGADEIKRGVAKVLRDVGTKAEDKDAKREVRVEIREIRNAEMHAELIAQSVAEQLERRMPFRRVIKRTLERVMANKEVEGAKIMVKGRLDGAEMSRSEFVKEGKLPLQTLRADIDFANVTAMTGYGVVGVKVWIYRGEKLD